VIDRADGEGLPQFLEGAPPVWAARGLSSILLCIAALTLVAALVVRVPETVSATFVLVPEQGADPARALRSGTRLRAELALPEASMALVRPGQTVKLLYDAFPYQRYGARAATLRWIESAKVGDGFRAFADLESDNVVIQGERRPLAPGMGGKARVVVGRRALVSYAFEPLRQLRESMTASP
jgi:multidrug efflux pump subunit AcrA (membrane-fusion protein)